MMTADTDGSSAFSRFEACVGSDFVGVGENGGTTIMSLVEARPSGPGASANPPRPFSLIFAALDETATGQGNYRLAHPQLGELEIFLVPVARGAKGLLFEAIFN